LARYVIIGALCVPFGATFFLVPYSWNIYLVYFVKGFIPLYFMGAMLFFVGPLAFRNCQLISGYRKFSDERDIEMAGYRI